MLKQISLSKFAQQIPLSRILTILFAVACLIIPASSLEAAESIGSAAFESESSIDSILRVFFALLCVILVIVTLSLVVKKYNILPASASNQIRIVSGISLNNKDRLLLIRVGSEHLLIAASPGNINKIHKLSNYAEPEVSTAANTAGKNDFHSLFKSFTTGRQP